MAALVAGAPKPAAAEKMAVVDRVVAVVDDLTAPPGGATTFLLSDVRARAKPVVARTVPKPNRAQLELLYREVVRTLIDEAIVAREAKLLDLTVSDAEIDRGIDAIAAHEHTTRAELLAAVVNQLGMTELEYRDEVRRMVLDQKWVAARIMPRVERPKGARDDDPRFADAVASERRRVLYQLAEHYYVMVAL